MNTFNCLLFGLLACVWLTSASPPDEAVDNYVIGGRAARPGQFPFVVSFRPPTNRHFCAGVILSDLWIATTWSCTSVLRTGFYIAVGAHTQNDGQRIHSARIIPHVSIHVHSLMTLLLCRPRLRLHSIIACNRFVGQQAEMFKTVKLFV